MSDAGSLTIYDKYNRQVASTASSNGSSVGASNPAYAHHATFGVKNGTAKVAFFYSGPEGRTSDMAMRIAHGVVYR